MKRLLVSIASAVLCVTAVAPAWAATDPHRSRQWGLSKIRADQAWSASKGSGVTIAIVDSGIDLTHPDLKGKIASHYSCVGGACTTGSTAGDDDHGHGSHVAGVAAAATNNGIGVAGVAPAAKLMGVKVLEPDVLGSASGTCSDIIVGIHWAADHGADVINLSLGPELTLDVFCGLQNAAEYAWSKGVVVVVAAGNNGLFNLYESDGLIVVGATGPDDQPASYSNSGADIYAPGGDRTGACRPETCIHSAWKDGRYASIEGTSMATPHVSGIAALLVARGYRNTQILARLKSTADNVGGVPRVNAARAVGTVAGTKVTKSPSRSGSGGGGAARPSDPASQSASPQSRASRTPAGLTGTTPLPFPPTPSYALEGAAGGPTSSSPPSRPWVISVAGGLAMLSGAGILRRILRTG